MSLDKAIEHGKEHRKPYRLYRTKKELEKWRNRLAKTARKDI